MSATPQPSWTPPTDARPPADGWKNNAIAIKARRLVFWSLGVLLVGWISMIGLMAMPSATFQIYGIVLAAGAILISVIIAMISVVFAAVGVYRSGRLGGYHRGIALAALISGLAILVLVFPLSFLANKVGYFFSM